MSAEVLARQSTLVVLDFETTEARASVRSEPVQAGWVVMRQGQLDPTSIGEIRLLQASRLMPLSHHWLQVGPIWTAHPLVAHSVGTERRVLRQAFPMHRFGPWIDTLVLGRVLDPESPSFALEHLLERWNLRSKVDDLCPGRAPHDAVYDAIGAACLLESWLALPALTNCSIQSLLQLKPDRYHQRRRLSTLR